MPLHVAGWPSAGIGVVNSTMNSTILLDSRPGSGLDRPFHMLRRLHGVPAGEDMSRGVRCEVMVLTQSFGAVPAAHASMSYSPDPASVANPQRQMFSWRFGSCSW